MDSCAAMSCPPGTYASTTGATNLTDGCLTCTSGKYSPGGSESSCASCPSGNTSPPRSASISSCVCQDGYRLSAGSCKRVITSASCPLGYVETGLKHYAEKYCYSENEVGFHCGGGVTVPEGWYTSPQSKSYWTRGLRCEGIGQCYKRAGSSERDTCYGVCIKDCDAQNFDRSGGTCTHDTLSRV